ISFIDKAKSIEPYAYIVKPFQPRQLLASIEMALYKSQMEKKLHEAQEWFSITLKSIGDCVIATDLKGNIKFMNTVAEAVTGWNMDEVGGKPVEVVFNIINEETGEPAEDPVTRVIREGTVAGLANHTLLITKDGTKIHIDDSGAPIMDDRGNIIGVVLVFYDITEQKRAEEELKISHKTYLGIINSLTEAIYIQDENGVFLEVNKAAEKFYGYPKEYFIGKTPELISAPGKNDIPMIAEAVKKAFNGESQSFEFWGLRKNGTIFPKSVNLTSGEYFGKKVVIATARDITERIRAKLELQVMYEITHGVNTTSNLDELLKLIHTSLKKVIYAENCFVALHDQNTGLFSFPYFVDKFDPTPMPIAMRKSCTAYVFRTGKPLLLTQELFERLVEQNKVELVGTNSPSWLGVPLLTPSRTIGVLVFQHYEEENVYSEQDVEFLDSAGNQIAIAIERKRAEEAIQESQKNFMDLFDNAPIGYHEIDSEGRITRINSTELEMLGYTYDEMIGQPIWKYNSDEKLSYQAVQKKLSGKLIETQAFERCLKRKDGTRVLVLIEEKILKDNAGKITGIRTTLQDITERKRAEEALRESEERFTAFMNNSPIVAWLKDPVTWTFCYINSAFEEVFDITQEVITRKTDFDLWPEEIARQLRENDLRVLSSDKAIQTSEDVPLPDGTVHHWLVFKFPLHTPSGKRFLAGTAVDITERKQAEDEIISQKNKFAQLFENSPIAIALLDDQGKIVQINESFSALFDYYHD
ncbi:MAG: PAS domain S-box protein, partial [Bacteroidetes bacterium]|nr:PAS domain S-box protein [Bacteroidota bacterium]